MAGRFSIEAVFRSLDRFTRPIARMQSRMQRFTRSVERGLKQVNKATSRVVSGLKSVGVAAVAVGAAAGAALANVARTGLDFEQTLTNAAAKFPGEVRRGTEAFAELEEASKRVGSATEFTASQSAEALNFLAMAGFDAKQSVAALPGVVDLATAATMELGEATDVATDSLGAFGLVTKDATQLSANLSRVNDVLAKTATTANTDVAGLFEAIKEGAPVATSAGASIETFSALLGEMANAGIKGGVAGTTLKNVFLKLSAPVGRGAKALRQLGVRTRDAQGNLRDVIDIIGDLNKGLDGMGTADRAGALEAIFGKIPIAGVNVLLQSGADKLRTYRETLEGASGAAANMAATMRDTGMGDLKSFESAVEGVKLEIFDTVRGPLRDVVKSATEWTRANKGVIASGFAEFVTKLGAALPTIVKWGGRIGRAVGVFLAVAAAVKVAAVAVGIFNAVMAANPAVLVAYGVIAAVSLIAAFWPEITAALQQFWRDVVEVASAIGGVVKTIWEPIRSFLVAAFEFLVGYWGTIFDVIATILGPTFELIRSGASAVFEWITAKASAASTALVGVWSGVSGFFSSLWASVKSTFDAVFGGIFEKISAVVSAVREVGRGNLGALFGGGESSRAEVSSPQERTARSISETTTTNKSEVTIRDETGRAEVSNAAKVPTMSLRVQPTGGF